MTAFFKNAYHAVVGFFISLAIGVRLLSISESVGNFIDALKYNPEAFRLSISPDHPFTLFLGANPETDHGQWIDEVYELDGARLIVTAEDLAIWDRHDNAIELSIAEKYALDKIIRSEAWSYIVHIEASKVEGEGEKGEKGNEA